MSMEAECPRIIPVHQGNLNALLEIVSEILGAFGKIRTRSWTLFF